MSLGITRFLRKMSSCVAAPFHFWSQNPVIVKHDVDLDNSSHKFDSLVVIASNILDVSVSSSSFLNPFVQLIKQYKEHDSSLENSPSFIVPSFPENKGIHKLIYSPVGPLDRHYDDVRRFYDASLNGIKRALTAGSKRPLLAVLYADGGNLPKYSNYDLVSLLGAAEGAYVPLEIREDVPAKSSKIEALGYTSFGSLPLPLGRALENGRVVARDIGGSDPERMAAPNVADYVKWLFANTCVKVQVIEDIDVIEKEYPLLAAVNRAAKGVKRHQARVIFLTYEPEKYTKTLAFVGKGVTYDTGGADLKVEGHMAGMHRDKCGAATVAGIFKTLSEIKPKGIKVMGAMCMVRNSIGSECYVSDELITSRAGVRIRIGNTDAEGRMAMGDVLCHMKEKVMKEPNPHIFTIATLTGHACLAVGDGYSIIVDNGAAEAEKTAANLLETAYNVGDIFDVSILRREDYEFVKGKSEYEDLLQSNALPSSKTPRGHIFPAAFLLQVSGLDKHDIGSPNPLKFSHIDIAASSGPFPGIPSGSAVPALVCHFAGVP